MEDSEQENGKAQAEDDDRQREGLGDVPSFQGEEESEETVNDVDERDEETRDHHAKEQDQEKEHRPISRSHESLFRSHLRARFFLRGLDQWLRRTRTAATSLREALWPIGSGRSGQSFMGTLAR